jgi:hypothetical protein
MLLVVRVPSGSGEFTEGRIERCFLSSKIYARLPGAAIIHRRDAEDAKIPYMVLLCVLCVSAVYYASPNP